MNYDFVFVDQDTADILAAEFLGPPLALPPLDEDKLSNPKPLLGDDPSSLSHFKRVFATWDFSEGTD